MPGFRGGFARGGRGGFMPFGGRGGARVRAAPAGNRVYIGNLSWNVQWQVSERVDLNPKAERRKAESDTRNTQPQTRNRKPKPETDDCSPSDHFT